MRASSVSELEALDADLALLERLREEWKLAFYYPADGPLRRELYAKQMQFFRLGATHDERLFMAGNRVGKTEGAGGYEITLHLTGLYPDWWEGRRFDRPTDCWVAGSTGITTRDIIQAKLLGPVGKIGTGLIPKHCIARKRPKQGVPDAIDTLHVRHVTGGLSVVAFKSYDQGRRAFEGTEKDVVWFDEEPTLDVYGEGFMRTAATKPGRQGGLTMITFTPLKGMSETVLSFLPNGEIPL